MAHHKVIIDGKEYTMYISEWLLKQLIEQVKPSVEDKDFDYLFLIEGGEGTGKSVFAQQVAKVLDPDFNLDNIAFTPNQFIEKVNNAKQHSCIIFDEAFTGLSARASLSQINHLLVSLMMEMRQRNLFVILVMPTVFMLDKYVVLHRARCMFHTYLYEKSQRGYWAFFDKTQMKYLYLKGKQLYDYNVVTSKNTGRFLNFYTVDETSYRELKKKALQVKQKSFVNTKYKLQRNALIQILNQKFELTYKQIAEILNEKGFDVKERTIGFIINKEQTDNDLE